MVSSSVIDSREAQLKTGVARTLISLDIIRANTKFYRSKVKLKVINIDNLLEAIDIDRKNYLINNICCSFK